MHGVTLLLQHYLLMVCKLRAGDVLRKRFLSTLSLLPFFSLYHALTLCNDSSVGCHVQVSFCFYWRLGIIFFLILWTSVEIIELEETASARGTNWICNYKVGRCVLREIDHSSIDTIGMPLFFCFKVKLDRSKIYFKAFFFHDSFRVIRFLGVLL